MRIPYLDRYEILQMLGQGGMGVVYLARQKKLDRLVAIKAISPYLAQEEEVRKRFAAEASVLARLSHPHIVTLYDYIEEADALYLVMEYVEGRPLSELLKAGPLPMESIRKYMNQVLEAFAYAHAKGVVHRDIKPSNIMVTPEGQVKILDFGVARILSTEHSQTRTGMRLGTLMYMSPEQVKGEKQIDARSDIYSLGVVLFEMLTGRPPYDSELGEFEISLRIVREPLFDLSRPPATIPQRLLEVILQATEKNPDHRFPDCRKFQDSLNEALGELLLPSLPTTGMAGPAPGPSGPFKKNWVWVGGLAVLLLAGLAALGFALWSGRPSEAVAPVRADQPLPMDTSLSSSQGKDTINSGGSKGKGAEVKAAPSVPGAPVPSTGKTPKKPSTAPSRPSTPASGPSPSDTLTQTTPANTPPPITFKEALRVEVQNFKKSGPLQVKADLILFNTSVKSWRDIRIAVHFFNKEGKLKKTENMEVFEIAPYGRWEKKLDYLIGGTARMEAEVLSAVEAP